MSDESMPVLSLWQPWASLLFLINPATGRPWKSIETRGHRAPKAYIGKRIAIQAAITLKGIRGVDSGRMCREEDAAIVAAVTASGVKTWADLPYGAILGTVVLADDLPMEPPKYFTTDRRPHILVGTRYDKERLLLCRPSQGWSNNAHGVVTHFEWATEVVTDQRPYGNFAPGRYAWLMSDPHALDEPVPFRGGQGFSKRWTPSVTA